MEFITVEQFKEQPIEVQKVFLDWWKCDYGDLYYYNEDQLEYKDFEIVDNNLECDIEGDFDYFKSIGVIPIFTEGQLRKFIEDKIGCKYLELIGDSGTNEYDLYCHKDIGSSRWECVFYNLGKDVLQAYWKVACAVAKEEIKQ